MPLIAEPSPIPVIILAAGSSSRLGRAKQQVVLGGKPLLTHAVAEARQAGHPVWVVLGANAPAYQDMLNADSVTAMINTDWPRGMGLSLKVGLTGLLNVHPKTEAVIVSVCDQPYLSAAIFASLKEALHKGRCQLAACRYTEGWGVPALFTQSFFDELLALPDEAGAKNILLRHVAQTAWVSFPQGHIDIDTPEDLARVTI